MKVNRRQQKEIKPTVLGEVVNADRVNIRKEPNINSEILGVVNHGAKFPIIGDEVRGFHNIDFDGTPAFIHSGYFEPVRKE